GLLTEHPRRQTWARPGGSAGDLAWAAAVLASRGTPPTGRQVQVRAWNLSSLWRIPTAAGPVWLKVVPPFFAHEGAMLQRVTIGPPVLATDGPRSLLADVPGDDLYEPSPAQAAAMVRLLVAEQARWTGRVSEVLALGAPDWRGDAFVTLAADVVERTAAELDPTTAAAARRLVAELPATFAALAACGIPDSLVHGDFHGGNVRADGERLVLLDWGDSGVGHPLLDQPAAVEHLDDVVAGSARAAWTTAWRDAAPGSDPERAARLVQPVAALRQAVIYRRFLDAIEPAEQPFHRRDPAQWIRRAVRGRVSARSPRGT
ncbi:MAG TPA: phosphotransferase, partial [Ilumatobacteraceae bacterium]|nr:phosphotransferase [Ilumatobacteraceae bacterium]